MMPCLHAVRAPDRAPENFAAIATSTKVQFSWSLPSNIVAEPSNMLLGYTLTCKPINVTGVTSMLMTYNEARSHTLGGFRPSTEYNCSLFAYNGVGSGPSASISVTTLDECKPNRLTR